MNEVINIKKMNERAVIPTRSSKESAGFDLYCADESVITIKENETVKIHTGIQMEIPDGYVGLIFARSGLATKNGLRPANCVGVIDSDYRGEIIVALHNDSNIWQYVNPSDRVAQIVIIKYFAPSLLEVSELSSTERNDGGFGHSGR